MRQHQPPPNRELKYTLLEPYVHLDDMAVIVSAKAKPKGALLLWLKPTMWFFGPWNWFVGCMCESLSLGAIKSLEHCDQILMGHSDESLGDNAERRTGWFLEL